MTREMKIMLVISALFALAMGLSNIFVNIFLWKKSNDFLVVAQYNLMHYIFVPFTFIAAGWIAKKWNGVWSLRLGIAFFIIFFTLILFYKDNIIQYIYPLGILFGIAAGFYWLAFHVLSFDSTSTGNRDTFNGINGCMIGAANAAAPIIGATIIEKSPNSTGYSIVFMCSLALFVILILISLLLKTKQYGSRLNFEHIWHSTHSDWTKLRKSIAAWGLRDVVIGFLVSVLIFKTTGSEMSVGKLSLIAAIISSVACYTQQKLIKPQHRLLSMYLGASFMVLAVVGLTWKIQYMTLLIFIVLDAAFIPFFTIPLSSASFNIINKYHEEDLRVEYVINKEIALNAGRVISTFTLILLLCFVKYIKTLNYFLLTLGCTQLISIYFLRKLHIWKSEQR